MKKYVLSLVCALLWASLVWAQDSGPNPRQSVAYFVQFVKENTEQLSQVREILEQDKKDPQYPYTEASLFYTELDGRLEQAASLAMDLCDLYYIYHRATYCFAKEEKSYLLSRIDNIASSLERLTQKPFIIDTTSRDGDKARMDDAKTAFLGRLQKLRTFIPTTMAGLNR